jgi:hypothetical protein
MCISAQSGPCRRPVIQAKPLAFGCFRLAWLLSNEAWQWRDDWLTRDTETTSEIVPECHAEFGARLGQSEEGIAAVTSEIAAGCR